MFATRNGPTMLEQGNSYIQVDTGVTAYMLVNRSTSIAFAIYAASEDHHHDSLEGMCGDSDINENQWATNIQSLRVPTTFVTTRYVFDPIQQLNGTYYIWKANLNNMYTVRQEAWHNVAFQFCASEYVGAVAQINGGVTFRNPYGYIPAELFGFLPFEGARMIAYVLFGSFFLFCYIRYRESVLPLHTAILVVFFVALCEATTWYAAYQTINLSGEPYCCPFPPTVVASLVLQVFRQTFARALLLVVSLGYGIVRPKLLPSEWIATIVVSLLYFISATISQVSEIILVHDVHGNSPENALPYQMPELFMDVIFLTWIYVALGSTIRILTDYQQTYKLLMYKQLAFTIALFVGLFGFVTVLILLDKFKFIAWPWQWAWAQQVLWEILNFAVLAAVCLVCRPSDTSRLLSYASQLPTEDPDDYDKEGDEDGSEEEDEDEDDNERIAREQFGGGKPRRVRGRGSMDGSFEMARRGGGTINVSVAGGEGYTLPVAEDQEFGLDEN